MHLRSDPAILEETASSLTADAQSLHALVSVVRGASIGPPDPSSLAGEVDRLLADTCSCLALLATTAEVLAGGMSTAARAYTGADERARLDLRSLHAGAGMP